MISLAFDLNPQIDEPPRDIGPSLDWSPTDALLALARNVEAQSLMLQTLADKYPEEAYALLENQRNTLALVDHLVDTTLEGGGS